MVCLITISQLHTLYRKVHNEELHCLYYSANIIRGISLLLRIREVQGTNLGPETDYPDQGLSWFFSDSPGECRDNTLKLIHDRFLSNLVQFIIHLSPFY
jgi:hypothetical protein